MSAVLVVAALRSADPRALAHPLTGTVPSAPYAAGAGPADRCALEHALRLAERLGGRCVAVTVGPQGAEEMLREALAAGADEALRIQGPDGDEAATAHSLLAGLAAAGLPAPDVVVCGDRSVDRGTGATPAHLAARLGAAQALGLLELAAGDGESEVLAEAAAGGGTGSAEDVETGDGEAGDVEATAGKAAAGARLKGVRLESVRLRAVRRLDGGRAERLEVPLPAVCSVEPGSARPRRAPLGAALAARRAVIPVVRVTGTDGAGGAGTVRAGRVRPYRPRAKALPAPEGGTRKRLLALTGALAPQRTPPRVVTPATPEEAAELLLAHLREHGVAAKPA
ncbi:mycofactocin-associated electron transfer flavoprotein beta subunit [Streptomyces andamanensis]|uniref:Mycofactocin-associated electron transfer flavoprotein beta subunit n=1 Tax=Streptomyces andamanensis TaxID=1565035 RepID=A0ABV8TJ13_9ACTN